MKGRNKKGAVQLGDTPGIIIALLLIGIFVAVGSIITFELQDNQKTAAGSVTVNNESETAVNNGTVFALDEAANNVDFVATDLLVMTNSSGTAIDSGNYTFDANGDITFNNESDVLGTASTLNHSYTYTATLQDDFWNTTNNALGGLDTISSFQTVIAVVVAAAIILGVVFFIRT